MPRFDFQEIVERLPLVVYIDELDELSSPLYVSTEIERLLGYTRDEWLANPELFSRSLHPDDRERLLAEIEVRNTPTSRSATRGSARRPCRAGRSPGNREAVRGRRAQAPSARRSWPRQSAAKRRARLARLPPPRGRSSVGRASASQAEGRGFEPHRPLLKALETGLFHWR